MTATIPKPIAYEPQKVQAAVKIILDVLRGQAYKDVHHEALDAFIREDHGRVKRLATMYLSDSLFRSLGYLGSALKLTPNTDTILAEAARAAADFQRECCLYSLGKAVGAALD